MSNLRGNKIKTLTCAALSVMVILVALPGTAHAITGNYTPNPSTYVGVVVFYSDESGTIPIGYCSGILISPSVVLTAGHATINAKAAKVCFDKEPISYSIENGQLDYSGNAEIYVGSPETYPEYSLSMALGKNFGAHLFESSDVGIIILNEPVDVEPNSLPLLPDQDFSSSLPVKTNLEVIGYGMQFQITPKNNGVINSWFGDLSCNSAQTQLIPGNFVGSDRYLKLTANPSQDKGGVSFGDSGGPVIYQASENDILLAINTYVSSANCNGITYHTRLDVQEVLDWINSYL